MRGGAETFLRIHKAAITYVVAPTINQRRKEALQALAQSADFPLEHVAFVTAYMDRSRSSFKKTIDALAWGSYA